MCYINKLILIDGLFALRIGISGQVNRINRGSLDYKSLIPYYYSVTSYNYMWYKLQVI